MAKSLVSLLNSPECEDYIGPVLITNDASPNFFSQVLSKSLSGRPSPFSQSTSLSSSYSSSQLLRKIGKKIMPEYLSVFDDSYAERFSNQILFGHYKYDDEGVKASKVQIVENGILKELLMCRKPNNKISKSNGHGRHDLFHKSDARPSNVFITSTQNIGYLDLKNKLVKICKEQGLEYGIIIKKISDIGVFSQFVESFSSSLPSSRSNEISVSLPIFVYRVFTKDGREELIRGLNFSNINLKTLDDIVSASNDSYVYNLNQKGNTGDLPTSFIAPSVLIEEMELVCEKEQNKKPPILKHPYFSER
jgi:predicted Zn-dependent protease